MKGDAASILTQMVVLFLIIGAGYVCKKTKLTDAAFDKRLSNIILSVTLPAMMLGSVVNSTQLPEPRQVITAFLVSCLAYVIMIAVSMGVTALLRVEAGSRGAFRFMMVFGNVGFLGFPVITAIYGPDALIYAAIYNLPFNFLCFTVGTWFISQDVEGAQMEKVTWRTFLTPCIVACIGAIVLALLGVHGVPLLGEAFDRLGSMTTPGAMLVIGSQLANLPVRDLFGGPKLWAACAMRLLVMPVLVFFALHFIVGDPLTLGTLVVGIAMPVANAGAMLCQKYDGNAQAMSQGIFVSTLFAIASIPVLVFVMG